MFVRSSLLLLCICWVSCTSNSTPPEESTPQIILKLDDLWNKKGHIHPGWQQVVDFLNQKEIVGTIGLIGESLEEEDSTYFQWIQDRHQEGHEIWHHGYCHCKPEINGEEKREFRGTDFEYQLAQLQRTQQLAKDKLGITFKSFGAPYNSTDSSTAKALDLIPELQVWIYKETSYPTEKYILPRVKEVNIEYPVHIPDFEQFKEGFEKHRTAPLLTIQGHPRSWVEEPERFKNFQKIINYLQEEGAEFTTPYAYYQSQQ